MKKITVIIGSSVHQESLQGLAIHIALSQQAALFALCLKMPVIDSYATELLSETELRSLIDQQDQGRTRQLTRFRIACAAAGLTVETAAFDVDFLADTLYSDLIILTIADLAPLRGALPGDELRKLLGRAQCPLLLVPGNAAYPSSSILLYDGHWSSVYAMKMFSYLLPGLADEKVEVLQVTTPSDENGLTDSGRLTALMKYHHPNVSFTVLHGEERKLLQGYLASRRSSTLLVMGAYGRSRLSRWLRSSTADALFSDPDHYFFIAHR